MAAFLTAIARAWEGFREFAAAGKFLVLLVAALLYLLIGEKRRGPQGRLMLYGAVMTVFCICPLTAMILMKYQTAFYDYQWIWSLVPVTALIGYGTVCFWKAHLKSWDGYRNLFFNICLIAMTAGAVLLCGGAAEKASVLGTASEQTTFAAMGTSADAQQKKAAEILSAVRDCFEAQEELCLCAPAEIVEYAGTQENHVKLLYGRNMWDAALNAYSYDVYPEETKEIYSWMEKLSAGEETSPEEGMKNIQKAFEMGADCVLIPKQTNGWTPVSTEDVTILELENYYLFRRTGR